MEETQNEKERGAGRWGIGMLQAGYELRTTFSA